MATTDPKTATEGQWADLANRVQSKAEIGSVLSTPSDVAYVGTNNIVDGAVTANKIDFSTFGNQSSYVEIGNILIAWGSSSLSCQNNTDTRSDPISYGVTFASNPKVFIEPHTWAPVRTQCAIGITTTTFRALLSHVFGSTLTIDFSWMAIGVKA